MRRVYDIVLIVVVVWHITALLTLSPPTNNPLSFVPIGLGALAFVCGVMFHPGKTGHAQGYTLSWTQVFRHVPRSEKNMFVALCVYAIVVTSICLALAALRHGSWSELPREAFGPIGESAVALLIAGIGWAAGRSGVNLKQKLIAEGTWFGR